VALQVLPGGRREPTGKLPLPPRGLAILRRRKHRRGPRADLPVEHGQLIGVRPASRVGRLCRIQNLCRLGPLLTCVVSNRRFCVVMTLADIPGPDQYLRAPRIDRAEVRLLWHSDYCDGPRSGMLVFRSEECWFQVVSESEDDGANWYRPFLVLRLS